MIVLTLKQRKLNKALSEPWQDDFLRRREEGWSLDEIAAFYRRYTGKITKSCLSKWAKREKLQKRERQAAA